MADNENGKTIYSVVLHPVNKGVEDKSINLLPETRPQTALDINSEDALLNQVLSADGEGSAFWRTPKTSEIIDDVGFTHTELNGASGKALIFNEEDGGGAKFEHKDGTNSFVGVNDGGANGIAGQIYVVNKNDPTEGVKINLEKSRITYIKNKATSERSPSDELAVLGDVADLESRINDTIDALEEDLNDKIEAEALARESADNNLADDLSAEVSARESADTGLGNRITAIENDYLTSTDKIELQNAIDQEVLDRQSAISGEADTRADADSALSGRLDTIEGDYLTSSDKEELQQSINTVDGKVDDEQARAELAEQALTDAIDGVGDDLSDHIADTSNPHAVTAAQVGLGNVDNTADIDKPISSATQTALNNKQDTLTFDTAPTADSTNPVTSGGIKTYVDTYGGKIDSISIDGTPIEIENKNVDLPAYPTAESLGVAEDIEVVPYQDQEPLTEEQVQKALDGKLAVSAYGRLYTKGYQYPDGSVVDFYYYSIGRDISSSTTINEQIKINNYVIHLFVSSRMLDNPGPMPYSMVSEQPTNFFNSSEDPTEDGKKIVREQNLYKVTTVVAGKQDTIADLDDIRAGAALGDTAVQPEDINTATQDDIDSLFPEEVATPAEVRAALADNSIKYVELEDNVSSTGTFDVAGADVEKTIDLNGNTIQSTNSNALRASSGASLTINGNGSVQAQEFGIVALTGSNVTINGGTFTTVDNCVLGTNGSTGYGENTLVVNGGEFNGHITSNGYIACGVYAANNDDIILNGGTFNIYDGCGVCVRSGKVAIGDDVVFNMLTEHEPALVEGKVGDSKILVPAGVPYVLDLKANYPGGKPSIVLGGVTYDENNIEAAREAGITVLVAE